MSEKKKYNAVCINNRKAKFDYEFIETFVAGIVLTGTEIKSIREGKASLVDTYCYVLKGEVWIKNSYIAKYKDGTYLNHEERRERKLLLHGGRGWRGRGRGVIAQAAFAQGPSLPPPRPDSVLGALGQTDDTAHRTPP